MGAASSTTAKDWAESLSQSQRVAYMRVVQNEFNLTTFDLAKHTGYAQTSVQSWLSPPESPRYRKVPARAVRLLAAEVKNGYVTRR